MELSKINLLPGFILAGLATALVAALVIGLIASPQFRQFCKKSGPTLGGGALLLIVLALLLFPAGSDNSVPAVSGSPVSGSPVSGSPVSGSPVSGSTVSGNTVSGIPVSGRAVSRPHRPQGRPTVVSILAPILSFLAAGSVILLIVTLIFSPQLRRNYLKFVPVLGVIVLPLVFMSLFFARPDPTPPKLYPSTSGVDQVDGTSVVTDRAVSSPEAGVHWESKHPHGKDGHNHEIASAIDVSEPGEIDLSGRVVVEPSIVGGVKTIAVTIGPFDSKEECRQELYKILQIETIKFAQSMFQDNFNRTSDLPTLQYLRDNLVSAELYEDGVGVFTLKVKLTFSQKVQSHLRALRSNAQKKTDEEEKLALAARKQTTIFNRLMLTGVGTTSVLALLGLLFGYLKWTAPKSGNISGSNISGRDLTG